MKERHEGKRRKRTTGDDDEAPTHPQIVTTWVPLLRFSIVLHVSIVQNISLKVMVCCFGVGMNRGACSYMPEKCTVAP